MVKRALLLLALTKSAYVAAQDTSVYEPLDDPEILWEQRIIPENAALNPPNVRQGNGVFISPDQSIVVATSIGATVTAFDALTGEALWDYDPPTVSGKIITCPTGVTFVTGEEDVFGNLSTDLLNELKRVGRGHVTCVLRLRIPAM